MKSIRVTDFNNCKCQRKITKLFYFNIVSGKLDFFIYIYMNIVLTNKYNKKLQSSGALNIKETSVYKQEDNLKNNK